MPSSVYRSKPFTSEQLHALFNKVQGYYDFGNQELASTLLHWNLLDDSSRVDSTIAYKFLKWSLTVSFVELINALQWFSAGVILYRQSYFPAQIMQMYYYSIFFSCGSFLAAHGKGHYTVKEELLDEFNIRAWRKVVWFENQELPYLCIDDKGRYGEHEFRAKWFYEALKSWDKRNEHSSALMFETNRDYHTGFRNMFTYSLSTMAEELHYWANHNPESLTNDILVKLWNRDASLVEYFPEEFWVFEHLKVPLGVHIRLLEKYESGTPYNNAQTYIIERLLFRHKTTGMKSLLCEILQPILSHMKLNVS